MKTGLVWACLGIMVLVSVGCRSIEPAELKPTDQVVFRFNSASEYGMPNDRGAHWYELALAGDGSASYRTGYVAGWDRQLTGQQTQDAFAKLSDAGLLNLSSDAPTPIASSGAATTIEDNYSVTGKVAGRKLDVHFPAAKAHAGNRQAVIAAFNELIKGWGSPQAR